MLEITIPAVELYDEATQRFVNIAAQTLRLEHSLVSISKWESKWCKPFLSKSEKTHEEIMDYIKCMTLTQNVDPDVYARIDDVNLSKINEYINAPMTATTFANEKQRGGSGEQITSELIYYWMTALTIPFECQKWHLNRLLTLIKVCNIKNQPPKKMSKQSIMKQNTALNQARRNRLNSKG